MRMFAARIDLQFAEHVTAQGIFGQHAFDGEFEEIFGFGGEKFFGVDFFDAADITGMVIVFLFLEFSSCQDELVGIDDNDVFTRVDVRRINRTMFAAKDARDDGCGTTNMLAFQINPVPVLFNLTWLCAECFPGIPYEMESPC